MYVNDDIEESKSWMTANNHNYNNIERIDLMSNSYTVYRSFWDQSQSGEVKIL